MNGETISGRWYEAVGGTGLEVRRGGGDWRCAGYIQHKRGQWEVRVNPYHDEGYALGHPCDSLETAKQMFLMKMGVSVVEVAA